MAIVGPGAIEDDVIAPSPTLEGASEFEYITILNPLNDDFAIMVAQSKPVNTPFQVRAKTQNVQDESDLRREYGLNLKNPDHKATAHIINKTVIRAGRTINLKGDEAQVAVRQLVNEIMQREGNRLFIADPVKRKEVEDRIIISRGSIQDLMDSNMQTPQQQANEAITRSNEVKDEQGFPAIANNQAGERSDTDGDEAPARAKRAGRPRKQEADA